MRITGSIPLSEVIKHIRRRYAKDISDDERSIIRERLQNESGSKEARSRRERETQRTAEDSKIE